MVFVLDNYDSFTYNLVQYMGELGAEMVIRRNDELTVEQIEDLKPERIVLSPGPCTPQEAGISIPLIRHFAGKVPILGVCLGHQAIGAAFGGKCSARAAVDARQNQPGRARWPQSLRRPSQSHDLHPLSLADRCRRGFAGGA
jgi:anthranilate synthase/aminodeoxychorismate synthase-like glutamine amidotransferase